MELFQQDQLLTWVSLSIIPIVAFGLIYKKISVSRQHKKMVTYYSKYISTRQATNDLMEVIVYNIYSAKNLLVHARDIVKSVQRGDDSQKQSLDQAVSQFDNFSLQLDKDNQLSVDRSYTNQISSHIKSISPIKSIWFWLPTMIAFCFLLAEYLLSQQTATHILVLLLIVLLEIIALYLANKLLNKTNVLKQSTEKQLLSIYNLFDIRRIFIRDSFNKLNQFISQLEAFEAYCNSIPQARSYSRGVELLKRNSEVMQTVHNVTDINTQIPLISVSPLLEKAISSNYAPAAHNRNLNFVNNIQTGLSLHMTQDTIFKLIDPLIKNAIDFSSAEQTITFSGYPKSNKIELEIIDQGTQLKDQDMSNIFKFNPNKTATPDSNYISLSLRLARLIVSTQGGEIRVSADKKGTRVKLIIPKNRGHEVIKVKPTISKSSSRIS